MAITADRRVALADFLKSRRAQVERRRLGLNPSRGRTKGLSREEVAYHSSVSMTWYTWLEQARKIQPSREVINGVADTLQLDDLERTYVLELAGYASAARQCHAGSGRAPEPTQRLLDSLEPNPSYAIFSDWSIAGWNAAYQTMYPRVAQVPVSKRNLLRLIFTDPSVRTLLPDWEIASQRFMAEFRTQASPYLGDPAVQSLIENLTLVSPAFAEGWARHDLELFNTRSREFNHPQTGLITLEHHVLSPTDYPDLRIVIYTPLSIQDRQSLPVAPSQRNGNSSLDTRGTSSSPTRPAVP